MLKELLFISENKPEDETSSWYSLFEKRDLYVGIAIFVFAGILTYFHASRIPSTVLDGVQNPDVYFSADASRVHDNMYSRLESNHHRTNVHPLFSLIFNPLYQGVALVSGKDISEGSLSEGAISTGYLVSSLAGALTLTLFYFILRSTTIRILDSLLVCLLFCGSSFAIYWYAIPETYPWGVVSILFALLVSIVGCRRKVGPVWYLVSSLGTFSITTTNWTVGLLSKLTRYGLVKAIIYSGVVLFVACVLALLQRQLVPSSWYFFRIEHESNYVGEELSGGPLTCVKAAFFHTVLAADIDMVPHAREEGVMKMRMQGSAPGSASVWGQIAAPVWALTFAAGLVGLCVNRRFRPYRFALGIALLGQFVLHSVYGSETFLYAAHIGPMLLLVCSFALLTKIRPYVLGGMGLLVVLFFANNLISIQSTIEYLNMLPKP